MPRRFSAEHFTAEGHVYFVDTRTGESAWVDPEPNYASTEHDVELNDLQANNLATPASPAGQNAAGTRYGIALPAARTAGPIAQCPLGASRFALSALQVCRPAIRFFGAVYKCSGGGE